jgi:hypothetical protein
VEGTSDLEVAHIFRLYGEAYRQEHRLCRSQSRAMRAIEICRTAALGGHVYECDQCGVQKICYNSCRNRHCPKCQGLEKQRWLEQRCAELLPVPYFHVVFTVPEELNAVAMANPKWFYDLLFHCASRTLLEIAADSKHLGARIGVLAVLHTWGQTLGLHPHLHCIATGGGLSLDGQQWVSSRPGFFLPVRVLSRLFQGKFLAALKTASTAGRLRLPFALRKLSARKALLNQLYEKPWVVYSKPPFGSPKQVLAYLARYTHRVAISNQRLLRLEGDQVIFSYKDYAQGSRIRQMSIPAKEFIRRLLLHVLPEGFVRLRYYGLLSNRHRKGNLARCRDLLLGCEAETPEQPPVGESWQALLARVTGTDPMLCSHCEQGHLRPVQDLAPLLLAASTERSPP